MVVKAATRVALVMLAAVGLLAAAAPEPASAAGPQLGPKPARCGVGCWGRTGDILSVSYLADVTVEPLIARPGERLTATVVPMHEALAGWTWPVRGCKPNTAVCRWKAGAPGRRWQRLRMSWSNPIGFALTEAVYAVVGKNDAVLHGYVRDRAGDGVGGIRLRVSRIGARDAVTVTTGGDGYYSALVQPGRHSVLPLSRPRKDDDFQPASQTKQVRRGQEVRADFTLDTSMKVTVTADAPTIAADGRATATLTVRVTREGQPVEGVKVDVWPTRSSPAERAPVPVLLCSRNARFWPTELPGVAGAAIPDAVTTDARGEAVLQLRAGTIPGRVTVMAWAEDASGRLRRKAPADVKDTVDVTLAARAVGGTGTPATLATFQELLEEHAFLANVTLLTSNATLLADQLHDLSGAAGYGNLIFSPLLKPETGEQAVLVGDGATELGKDGVIASNAGLVLPFGALNLIDSAAFGGFAGAAKARQLPAFPGMDAWRVGLAPGYTSRAGSARSAALGWAYFGWPRFAPGCG
jgi:hypothetical protein